jgi:hypothetical protein
LDFSVPGGGADARGRGKEATSSSKVLCAKEFSLMMSSARFARVRISNSALRNFYTSGIEASRFHEVFRDIDRVRAKRSVAIADRTDRQGDRRRYASVVIANSLADAQILQSTRRNRQRTPTSG